MSSPLRLVAASMTLLLIAVVGAGCDSDDKSKDDAEAAASSSAAAGDALVQQGLDQLTAGDAAAAKVTFENVLALDSGNVYAHYNLGVIAQQAGKDEAAIAEYDAALTSDDAFAPALFNKGILSESTDLEAAVDLYRRAVAADPKMAAAYMRLGFALVHLGEEDEGAKYLGKGVQLDPSMADVEAPAYD